MARAKQESFQKYQGDDDYRQQRQTYQTYARGHKHLHCGSPRVLWYSVAHLWRPRAPNETSHRRFALTAVASIEQPVSSIQHPVGNCLIVPFVGSFDYFVASMMACFYEKSGVVPELHQFTSSGVPMDGGANP